LKQITFQFRSEWNSRAYRTQRTRHRTRKNWKQNSGKWTHNSNNWTQNLKTKSLGAQKLL